MNFFYFFILALYFSCVYSEPLTLEGEDTVKFWNDLAKNDIERTKSIKDIHHKAKNVILFIGDGMGVSTLTASRIKKGQLNGKPGEESNLFLETFPNTALIKTYAIDRQVGDSASTATTYLTGTKANFEVIGVGPKVKSNEQDCKKILLNKVDSILEEARKAGKATGVVTTTRITHATPSASYAHVAHRNYESDANMPKKMIEDGCKDIARQLIEDLPGKELNVVFGGGKSNFIPKELPNGKREDKRNLFDDWLKYQNQSGLKPDQYKIVNNLQEMNNIDINKTERVLGIFADDHLSYHALRNSSLSEPTLKNMTDKAIRILSKYPNGFVLLVEGGRIDHAHHSNLGALALHDTIELDDTIEHSVSMLNKSETLFVVTADHSHSLTINGYPERGNDILGVTGYLEKKTNKTFTTLMYSSGPGHQVDRLDAANDTKIKHMTYQQHSTVHLGDANHGGEDVALYSMGPMSYLYRGLHEQNYIPHVISYSACIGLYKNESHC